MPKRKPIYLREQTWAILIGMAVPILNRQFGLELTPVELAMTLAPILTFLGADGVVAAVKVHHERAAERLANSLPGETATPAESPGDGA